LSFSVSKILYETFSLLFICKSIVVREPQSRFFFDAVDSSRSSSCANCKRCSPPSLVGVRPTNNNAKGYLCNTHDGLSLSLSIHVLTFYSCGSCAHRVAASSLASLVHLPSVSSARASFAGAN
jgi:hypothetical protein